MRSLTVLFILTWVVILIFRCLVALVYFLSHDKMLTYSVVFIGAIVIISFEKSTLICFHRIIYSYGNLLLRDFIAAHGSCSANSGRPPLSFAE